jgi:hypothetical protein
MTRHTAALMLIGWYLMMPPWYKDEKEPQLHAPLADWEIIGSYDRADDCQNNLLHIVTPAYPRATPKQRRAFGVKCVATDDPRLKESSR